MKDNLDDYEEDIFAPKKAKIKRPKYYIKNEDIHDEMLVYYNNNVFTEKLGEYFLKIVEGIAHAPNFINYTWIEEMKNDAIEDMCNAVFNKKYKLECKDTAFSYFTRIAWTAFQSRIKIEQKILRTHDEYKEKIFEEFQIEHNIDLTQEQKNWD
jgi:hypothetical protein